MAVVLRNASVPGLAVTYEGIGTPLDMQPVTGANTRRWDLTPGGAGGTPGITIESVPAPGGNPVSPQGNIVVPNPTPTGWNIIPMGAGTFQIQNRANGQLWGLPALVPGTQVTLADPGAGANQLWFTS